MSTIVQKYLAATIHSCEETNRESKRLEALMSAQGLMHDEQGDFSQGFYEIQHICYSDLQNYRRHRGWLRCAAYARGLSEMPFFVWGEAQTRANRLGEAHIG